MFNTSTTTQVARVAHRCTWCGQRIEPGECYHRWVTLDGGAFTSKMHPECVDACDEECQEMGGEYMPFDNERPARPTAEPASTQGTLL